jgi:hypothetical protein
MRVQPLLRRIKSVPSHPSKSRDRYCSRSVLIASEFLPARLINDAASPLFNSGLSFDLTEFKSCSMIDRIVRGFKKNLRDDPNR